MIVIYVVCGLLMLLSFVLGYWLCKRDIKRACPLFRRASYCSGGNLVWREEYLERLASLFDYHLEQVATVIRGHPDDLRNQVEGWACNRLTPGHAGGLTDMNMLYRYLTTLEVCSQFQIHGLITSSMFWGDYEYRLRAIVSSKDLCLYIAHAPALCGLKAALVEAKNRIRLEEAEELLPL